MNMGNLLNSTKSLFLRNKNYLLISLVVLLLSFIMGMLFHQQLTDFILFVIKENFSPDMAELKGVDLFIDIFTNNLRVDFTVMLMGLLFSFFSLLIHVLNGVLVAVLAYQIDPVIYTVGIAPHGIIEFTASIISFAVALIITHMECLIIRGVLSNDHNIKDELNKCKPMLKDVIAFMVIVVILLFIAGVIESFVTGELLNLVV